MPNPVDQAISNTMDQIQQPAPQSGPKSFDFAGYVKDNIPGAKLASVNPDGSAQLIIPMQDGTTVSKKFNTNALLKDSGIDPSKVKVQYNTPDQALDDNPIGFADGMAMALAGKKEQAEFLQGKYGSDSVRQTRDGFVVNDNGVWKKADPSFVSKIASTAPEILGGGIGTETGAAVGAAIGGVVGSAVPVIGTLGGIAAGSAIGGFFGMAGGAALASVAKQKGIEALGINSENDAQKASEVFSREAIDNLVWQTVLGGLGKTAKVAGGAAADVFAKIDREALAQFAEKWLPGTDKVDWSTLMRSGEDASAVYKNIQKMASWAKSGMDNVKKGLDPMVVGISNTIDEFMTTAKKSAEKMYGDMWRDFEKSGITKAPVQIADTATQLKTDMINMGLIDTEKETGRQFFNPKPTSDNAERILQVFDAKSRNTIRAIYEQIQHVARDGGEITFDKAKMLLAGVDNVLEHSGFYKNGENALSNNVRRSLASFRESLSRNLMDGLEGKTVNGQDAQKIFTNVNSKYSQYRSVMNDFSTKFNGDLKTKVQTAMRMVDPEMGYSLEDSFTKLGAAVGKDAEPILRELQQMRAGRNLAARGSAAGGKLSGAVETLTGGPRAWASRIASVTEKGANAKATARGLKQAWNEEIMSKLPATPGSKTLAAARANMVDMLNKMTPGDKMNLVTNPVLLRSMVNAVEGAPQQQQQTSNALLSQIANVVKPVQQNGQQ